MSSMIEIEFPCRDQRPEKILGCVAAGRSIVLRGLSCTSTCPGRDGLGGYRRSEQNERLRQFSAARLSTECPQIERPNQLFVGFRLLEGVADSRALANLALDVGRVDHHQRLDEIWLQLRVDVGQK